MKATGHNTTAEQLEMDNGPRIAGLIFRIGTMLRSATIAMHTSGVRHGLSV